MKQVFKKIIVWILTVEAKLVLKKYKPKIAGITGSVGKTSTKDAVFTVLSSRFFARKSHKSFNSEIGIPLTILGCDNAWSNPFLWLRNIFSGLGVILFPNHYPEWLVLEVGLDRPGDISRVIRWIDFDVVVYTRLSSTPVHVEFFESPEKLLEEKKKLAGGLKSGGVLVTNKDDVLQGDIRNQEATHLTYGFNEIASITGSHVEISYRGKNPTGMTFRIDYAGASVPIRFSGVLGVQHVYPALAACAVGVSQKVHLVNSGKAFLNHEHLPGRMRILKGKKQTIIIDDSYNASPVATHAALDVFSEVAVAETQERKGRRICVLGDMTELGSFTVSAHEEVGKRVGQIAGLFVAVGSRMHVAVQAALSMGMNTGNIVHVQDAYQAAEYVRGNIEEGDVVLVKGSQSMRMERVVKELLLQPEDAQKLLVRQDAIWLKR